MNSNLCFRFRYNKRSMKTHVGRNDASSTPRLARRAFRQTIRRDFRNFYHHSRDRNEGKWLVSYLRPEKQVSEDF